MEQAEMVTITKAEYDEFIGLKSQVTYLKFQLDELKRMIFGAKSERFIAPNPDQASLFDLPAEKAADKPAEEITYTRNKAQQEKKQPLRMELPSHLERREEVIEPADIPENAKKIGEAITEVLEYEPPSAFVRRIKRPKYIVEQNDEETRIIIAPLPTLPIPKGNAGASILSHILVSKFVDHQPFYRQVQIFKRQDLNIAESTLGGWFNASCNLLLPLYEALKIKILSSDYLMADETPIPVLTKDKPGATHKGYHWVYYDPGSKLVLFDYQKTRGREGPDEFLKNFSGYLQTDGYTAYNNLKNHTNITLLACMAHARRKFEHGQENNPMLAAQAMKMFQALYEIERHAKEASLSVDAIKELRQRESQPILEELEAWLKEQIIHALPKSAIGSAMAYTLTLWPRLIRYIDDGRFNIDNNLIENSIRPVALGRKNYLFAGSHEAAQQAAVIYSLLGTCKINGVEPFSYLSKTLSVIPDHPANQLHTLLPAQK
ncbi:MAG: IS66 family transposase [Mariniphaga sp.]